MAIVIFQLLVSGVMGLKRMPVAAGLMFPLIFFTAYWGNELSRYVRFCAYVYTSQSITTDWLTVPPNNTQIKIPTGSSASWATR